MTSHFFASRRHCARYWNATSRNVLVPNELCCERRSFQVDLGLQADETNRLSSQEVAVVKSTLYMKGGLLCRLEIVQRYQTDGRRNITSNFGPEVKICGLRIAEALERKDFYENENSSASELRSVAVKCSSLCS